MKRLTLFLMCVMASLALTAQNTRLVKGLVFSEEDIPMQGVTLSVVGMNGTTQSTEDGLFELYVSPYAKKLQASAEGYIPHVLEIDGSYLVFKLKVDKEYAKRKAAEEEAARVAAEQARAAEEARIAAEREAAEKAAAEKAAAKAKAEERARKAAEQEAIAQAKAEERYTATQASEKSVPTKPTNTNGIKSEDSVTVSEKPDTYKVGDLYNKDGKVGIVFKTSAGGKRAKIISVQQTRATWEEAKAWCSLLGDGWRLPTSKELESLYNLKNNTTFNESLANSGAAMTWNGAYWSGEEYSDVFAITVGMNNGNTYNTDKDFEGFVCAVFDFKTTNSR